jgi:serine/threonine protein kinase
MNNTMVGNRYQIVREIGAGKMGRVYQAVDTETGSSVAAKVLTASGDDEMERLLGFYQEAAVLSTLKHPNIVQVYGTFLEGESSWIVMELLEGRSLLELLSTERLSLPRIRKIMTQVAAALGYAHEHKVVHRDIKPDNIMVLGDDRVKVTDFGLARILRPGTTLATVTHSGMTVRGLLYTAPEQIEGIAADGRADIYSVGAVMYHIVTGRPPFEGPDPLAVAFKTVNESPVPPREVNPQVPADWDALILKALRKNPTERFGSAAELERELSELSPRPGPMDRRVEPEVPPPSDETLSVPVSSLPRITPPLTVPAQPPPAIPGPSEWWERGRALERAGDPAAALESYRAGLNVAPAGELRRDLQVSVMRLLREQARAKERAGDVTGALDDYRAALAAAPSDDIPTDLVEVIHRLSTGGKPRRSAAAPRAVPALRWRKETVLAAGGLGALIVALVAAFLVVRPGAGLSAADKTATAQAITRAAARTAAQKAAAARAQEQNQAIAEAAELRGTGERFGPATGALTSTVYYSWAGQNLRDFVARVRFVNPPVLPQTAHLVGHRWGYGLWFRNFPDGGQFRLMLYSNKRYVLIAHIMSGATMPPPRTAGTGSIPNLNVSPGGANDVTLLSDGKTGVFAVNGTVVAKLDLSSRIVSGDVGVIGGAPWSNGLGAFDQPLRFENFTVWSLDRGQVGPKSGNLSGTGPVFAGLWTLDFIAKARFDNPARPSSQPWDYALAFRHTPQAGELRLVLNSNKTYELRMHDPTRGIFPIAHGSLPNMNVAPSGHNDVILFVDQRTGSLFLNGQLVTNLNLSRFMNGGDVGPGYGPLSESAGLNPPLRYRDFVVWPLIDTPQSPPPGTNSSTVGSREATQAQRIDGIPCQNHLSTYKAYFHLAITDAGKPVTVPAGIGVNPDPLCFYWLHSAGGGLDHVTWPTPYSPPLGDFFDIWRQPLSRTQVAGAKVGPGQSMKVYLNGKLYSGDPRAIRLTPFAVVDIQIGPPFHHPRPYKFVIPKVGPPKK